MRKNDSAWPNIGCAEARCDHKISLLDQRRHRASINDEQAQPRKSRYGNREGYEEHVTHDLHTPVLRGDVARLKDE
jgi:hypothetical protein